MRPPNDIAVEHARCPHQAQLRVTALKAPKEHGESATVEGRIVRVLRGSLIPGQIVAFDVPVFSSNAEPVPGDSMLTMEWLANHGHLEVCLTESLTLPSSESIYGLAGPSDQMHLELPEACQACPDGFLEQVAPPETFMLRARPELGCFVMVGSLSALGFLAGFSAIEASVLVLMPVAALALVLGLVWFGVVLLWQMKMARSSFECIRCGARLSRRP